MLTMALSIYDPNDGGKKKSALLRLSQRTPPNERTQQSAQAKRTLDCRLRGGIKNYSQRTPPSQRTQQSAQAKRTRDCRLRGFLNSFNIGPGSPPRNKMQVALLNPIWRTL